MLDAERLWDRSRDPDKYAHIWEGAYQLHAESRVFRNWRIDSLAVPEGSRPYFGADWGFAVDPTVLVRCYLLGRILYIDREAYRIGCPIDEIGALFRTIEGPHGATAWPITADSARPELIDALRREGFRIKPARKGKGSVEEGVAFLQAHDIVVHPECRHAIDELTLYSYKVDALTGDILPVLEDRHNHVIDALRYALEARAPLRLPPAQPGVSAAGRALPLPAQAGTSATRPSRPLAEPTWIPARGNERDGSHPTSPMRIHFRRRRARQPVEPRRLAQRRQGQGGGRQLLRLRPRPRPDRRHVPGRLAGPQDRRHRALRHGARMARMVGRALGRRGRGGAPSAGSTCARSCSAP